MTKLDTNLDACQMSSEILLRLRKIMRESLRAIHGKEWEATGIPDEIREYLTQRQAREASINWNLSDAVDILDFAGFLDLYEVMAANPQLLQRFLPLAPDASVLRIRFLELDTILNRIAYARPISESELGFLVTFEDRLKKTASAPVPAVEEAPAAPPPGPGGRRPRRRRLPRSPLRPHRRRRRRPGAAPRPPSRRPPLRSRRLPRRLEPGARAPSAPVAAAPDRAPGAGKRHQAQRQQGDPDGPLFDEDLEVEMQGDLIRTIGGRDRLDPLDGEHARLFPKMTIANEIEAAGSIPKPVGIDLPPGHTPACGRIVAHLDPFLFGNGLRDALDDLAVPFVSLMRTKPD